MEVTRILPLLRLPRLVYQDWVPDLFQNLTPELIILNIRCVPFGTVADVCLILQNTGLEHKQRYKQTYKHGLLCAPYRYPPKALTGYFGYFVCLGGYLIETRPGVETG